MYERNRKKYHGDGIIRARMRHSASEIAEIITEKRIP